MTWRTLPCPEDGEGRWADALWSMGTMGDMAAQSEPWDGFFIQIWCLGAHQRRICPGLDSLDVLNLCEQGSEPDRWSSAEGITGHEYLHPPLMELRKLWAEQDASLMQGCRCPLLPLSPSFPSSTSEVPRPHSPHPGTLAVRWDLGCALGLGLAEANYFNQLDCAPWVLGISSLSWD